MYDNDREMELDSDNEEKGGVLGSSKRSHHNALERKRRDHIKESFNGLRDSVPALTGEKASRAQILNKATEYIQDMTEKNACFKEDIEDLCRQNSELEHRIRTLERAKQEGTFDGRRSNLDQVSDRSQKTL